MSEKIELSEAVNIELTYDEATAVVGAIDTAHESTCSATRKICNALREYHLTQPIGSAIAMSEKSEYWYIFDINPEHIDPRLPQWLEQHGIVMKVNAEGKIPGVIANTFDDLPEYCHPIPTEVKPVLPLKITLSPTQLIPGLRELVDQHDSIHGKPYRFIREPLGEDFGRGAKLGNLVECLQGWLSEMLITLHRVMECDRAAFNYDGEEEIKTILSAICSLKTQYFEATSLHSDESVKANIFKYRIEQSKKLQQEHE